MQAWLWVLLFELSAGLATASAYEEIPVADISDWGHWES